MTKLSDTSPEAAAVLTAVYRRMPPGQKWLRLGQTYQEARALHAAGVRLRDPSATDWQIHRSWLEVNLGFRDRAAVRAPTPVGPMQNLHDLREVVRALVGLGIPYALGGSMASSIHGVDRYTRDADLTVEPFPGREADLAGAFGPDWYVSLPAVRQAVRQRSSFNLINTSTGFKVDVFVRQEVAFEQSAMARRVALALPDQPDQPIVVHTAEDVILFKLRWYRLGDESSGQQWGDVLGVLEVQAGKLDDAYLDQWAADLGVADLLRRARQEAAD
jgi:hypothetical protein